MTKVVHLTTVHRPTDVRIFEKEACTLAAAGYEVVLIACCDSPSVVHNVSVKAIPRPRNRWQRFTATAWRAYKAALQEHAEIYHFHDPELLWVGALLKVHGKCVVYDVHEDAAKDVYDKPYLPRWMKPLVYQLVLRTERVITRILDGIVAATPAIYSNFPSSKTVLVRNVPSLAAHGSDGSTKRPFRERSKTVAYIGGLATFNGTERMIRAMNQVRDRSVRLKLAGRFTSPEEESRILALPGGGRVEYLGWVDRATQASVFADARAGLVLYQPTPNVSAAEPNKFYEVLAAGLPLIASDFPHWREFIEKHDCGVVVPPVDEAAIANAIDDLVNNPDRAEAMGRRGQQVVTSEYNWEAESGKLLALYSALLRNASLVSAGAVHG